MRSILKITIFLCAILSCGALRAQKYFDVSIHFDDTTNLGRLSFQYDNGLKQALIQPIIKNAHSIMLRSQFYSRYATIYIILYNSDGNVLSYNYFWVTDIPATISYKNKLVDSASLNHPTVDHAYLLKNDSIVKMLDAFCLTQQQAFDSVNRIYKNNLTDTTLGRQVAKISDALHRRQMNFIRSHGSSYYCFWLFRKAARRHLFNADTLINIFESVFPKEFESSEEGRRLKQYLTETAKIGKNYASDFTSKDINGKTVNLKDFRGSYVLLHFWAPWCGPCMAEMPDISKIRNTFSKQHLKIISISLKGDTGQFKADIKKFNMDWINIYNDENIISVYSATAIPKLYLIDNDGKIIYKNYDLKLKTSDSGLKKLWKLLYAKVPVR